MAIEEERLRSTRRGFLKLCAGALVVAYQGTSVFPSLAQSPSADTFLDLVMLHPDGRVTIYAPSPDMGQGTATSVPMLIAEEADFDWDKVETKILPLLIDRDEARELQFRSLFQGSGGSTSIIRHYQPARRIGAQIRRLMINAAVQYWGDSTSTLRTSDSEVIDDTNQRRIRYADLIPIAAKLNMPVVEDEELKEENRFRLIGTARIDKASDDIVRGNPL